MDEGWDNWDNNNIDNNNIDNNYSIQESQWDVNTQLNIPIDLNILNKLGIEYIEEFEETSFTNFPLNY